MSILKPIQQWFVSVPKRYWWIIATYVLMQLSPLAVLPFLLAADVSRVQFTAYWTVATFCIALLVILLLLRKDMTRNSLSAERMPIGQSLLWAILGIFMAFAVQMAVGMIEQQLFGIKHASQNTKQITDISKSMPIFILVVAIIGPILEEIVFRKVLFGTLNKKFSFVTAALASALIFGLVHMELSFLLTYTAIGFLFAFLYWMTKRIFVSIIAHVSMNTFVVVMYVLLGDRLQDMLDQYEKQQALFLSFFG